jgi:DNA repair and recombination protein RAD52
MLDKEVIEKLNRPLDRTRVKHRAGGGGMSLAYLKGHNVIDTANELLGFGNWGYDILLVELVNITGEGGEVIGGYYAARVRLTVKDCVPITEEGICPIQEGRNPRARIDAHDMARKGAVTDAMKRAFRCYGDQFGNSLYDTDLVDGQPGTERSTGNSNQSQNQNQKAQTPRPAPAPQQAAAPASTPKPVTPPAPITAPAQAATQPPSPSNEMATAQQRQGILKIAGFQGMEEVEINRRLKELYAGNLDTISRVDASHFIKVLQGQA